MAAHIELDEPKSPLWLPAVGGVLFFVIGLWLLVGGELQGPAKSSMEVDLNPPKPVAAAPAEKPAGSKAAAPPGRGGIDPERLRAMQERFKQQGQQAQPPAPQKAPAGQ